MNADADDADADADADALGIKDFLWISFVAAESLKNIMEWNLLPVSASTTIFMVFNLTESQLNQNRSTTNHQSITELVNPSRSLRIIRQSDG